MGMSHLQGWSEGNHQRSRTEVCYEEIDKQERHTNIVTGVQKRREGSPDGEGSLC